VRAGLRLQLKKETRVKTVILVRHADIDIPPVPGPDDQLQLNAAGRIRAEAIAHVAGAAGVTAVFTSTALRTKQTAAPLATALGVQAKPVPDSLAQFVTAVMSAAGPAVLVVGHSNTVPQMIAALGATFPGPPIQGFDDLFVVTVAAPNQVGVIRFKYGAGLAPAGASLTGMASAPPLGPIFTDHAGAKSRGLDVEFRGKLFSGEEKFQKAVSGADMVGNFLVLVSDEMKDKTDAQLLERDGDGYKKAGTVRLPGNDEIDLEAVGVDRANATVYVTGSHAHARKIEGGVIGEVKRKKSREQFFRFKLKPDGTAGPVEGPKSLTTALEAHPVLKDFTKVASKENGIDIEGLAVKDGRLHFGFRGPVLRGGWVPVLSCTWDDPTGTAQVRYLRLGGRGVRDLVAVSGGFLVLAGLVGDGDGTYRVYFWDGIDQLPAGENGPGPQRLGEFTGLGEGKPEGLVVLAETDGAYQVLLLCDGLPNGGPTQWKLTRP
jgi:phosphohistidine phosphatase SixA